MAKKPSKSKSGPLPRLGQYQVVAHIATGGMGAVFKAKDTVNNRTVALKVLPSELAKQPSTLERFQREARSASILKHPNIVELYEIACHKSTWFLVMEYVRGIDLSRYIRQKGKLTPRESRRILFQTALALEHAYKQGIVHRDIKPSNFLLTEVKGKPLVKLTDFGLARHANDEDFRLTSDGTTVGTVDYIAPEQARDSGAADIRSDLYSLGCTLFHMLAGVPPYAEGGLTERLIKHTEQPIPSIRKHCPDIPEYLERALEKMLAKKPTDRYQSPRELLEVIARGSDEVDTQSLLEGLAEGSEEVDTKSLLEGLAEDDNASPELEHEDDDDAPVSFDSEPEPEPVHRLKSRRVGPRQPTAETISVEESKPRRASNKKSTDSGKSLRILLIGGGVVVLIVLIIAMMNLSGSDPKKGTTQVVSKDQSIIEPPPVRPPETRDDPLPPKKDDPPPVKSSPPPIKDKPTTKPPVTPPKREWPWLLPGVADLKVSAIQDSFYQDWTPPPLPSKDALRLTVQRHSQDMKALASLDLAMEAAQKSDKKDIVIELDDNGPHFVTSVSLKGKNLTLRAGKDRRPMLIWLLGSGKEKSLLKVEGGSLTVEWIDIGLSIPVGTTDTPSSFFEIIEGHFSAKQCSFSIAGSQSTSVTVAHLHGKLDKPRCSVQECYLRGLPLSVIDASEPGTDVLIEDSMITTGAARLIALIADEKAPTRLRIKRSTLVCRKDFLKVEPAARSVIEPRFHWKMWGTVITRSGRESGGTLFELPARCVTESLQIQAWNCAYAGWGELFSGMGSITTNQHDQWRDRWSKEPKLDRAFPKPWPVVSLREIAEVSPASYRTDATKGEPVGFASLMDEGTIGGPLSKLPSARAQWLAWTLHPMLPPTPRHTLLNEAPEIPQPNDGKYHGERVDLNQHDLGALLAARAKQFTFGPKIVLHLFQSDFQGKRQYVTPFTIKGSDVVLYLVPNKRPDPLRKDKMIDEPVQLVASSRARTSQTALIEVENGDLEIIGGVIRLPDFQFAQIPPYLVSVKNGSLHTINCRLEGPLFAPPASFRGLVHFHADKVESTARECHLTSSILLSPRNCLHIKDGDASVRLDNSLIVTNGKAIYLQPLMRETRAPKLFCRLLKSTFAIGEAVVQMDQVQGMKPSWAPMMIQSKDCAFLCPFSKSKPGILLASAEAFAQGQMMWQSEGDVFDTRLHFYLAKTLAISDKAGSFEDWKQHWGPMGSREAILSLRLKPELAQNKWDLTRLRLPGSPPRAGADFKRLGLIKSKE